MTKKFLRLKICVVLEKKKDKKKKSETEITPIRRKKKILVRGSKVKKLGRHTIFKLEVFHFGIRNIMPRIRSVDFYTLVFRCVISPSFVSLNVVQKNVKIVDTIFLLKY